MGVFITMTILAKLLAYERDLMGYITYVFECLDEEVRKDTKYIMCVRFPNWNHAPVKIGEIGYLNFREVQGGIDKWFDGNTMVPYRFTDIHFIKFVKKPEKEDQTYVM
jgi:hypothetical protein